MKDINVWTWYGQRELNYCPKHFVMAKTTLDSTKQLWVLEKLSGRFFIQDRMDNVFLSYTNAIYFEDPKEAVLYELTWS